MQIEALDRLNCLIINIYEKELKPFPEDIGVQFDQAMRIEAVCYKERTGIQDWPAQALADQ